MAQWPNVRALLKAAEQKCLVVDQNETKMEDEVRGS